MAAAGCGGDDGPPVEEPAHPLTPVVHELQRAKADGDHQALCDRLTRAAQRQAGSMAHGTPSACVRDVRRALALIADGGGWDEGDPPLVAEVSERGPRRAVVVVADGDWRAKLPFARERGRWRLDGFFGVGRRERRQAEATAPTNVARDRADEKSVELTDSDGRPCTDVSVERARSEFARYLPVRGGCVVTLRTEAAPIRFLTAFGGFNFAECRVDLRVAVAGNGRAFVDDWDVEPTPSTPEENGCSDVNACVVPGTLIYQPWAGRLTRDGDGATLRMRMCLSTCVGDFTGVYAIRLYDDERRAEPIDAGTTGFEIDGDLEIFNSAFEST